MVLPTESCPAHHYEIDALSEVSFFSPMTTDSTVDAVSGNNNA
jgi:hypothetical protein